MTIGNLFQDLGLGVRGADESVNARALAELRRRQLESAAHLGEMEQRQMGANRAMEGDYLNTWGGVGSDALSQPRGNPTVAVPVPPPTGSANGQWDVNPQPVVPTTSPSSFRDPNDYGANDLARLRGRGQVAQRMQQEAMGNVEVDKDIFQQWYKATGGRLQPGQNQRQAIADYAKTAGRPTKARSTEQLIQDEARTAEQPSESIAPQVASPTQTAPEIQAAAQKYGVPVQLMHNLWMAESSGGRYQQGPPIQSLGGVSARGHFQFIPTTAQQYGVQVGDLQSEADGAARYLSDLYKRTGSWEEAVARYGGHSATSPTRASYVGKVLNSVVPSAQAAPPSPSAQQTPPTAGAAAAQQSSIQFQPGQQFSAQTAQANPDDDMLRRLAASAFRMGQLKAFSGDSQGAMQGQLQGAQILLQLAQKQNMYAAHAIQAGDFGPALALMNQQMPGYNYTLTTLHNGQVQLSANGQPARVMSADDFYTSFRKMTDQAFQQQWTQFQMANYQAERKHIQTMEVEQIKGMAGMLQAAITGNARVAAELEKAGIEIKPDTNTGGAWLRTRNGAYFVTPGQNKIGDMVSPTVNVVPIDLPR